MQEAREHRTQTLELGGPVIPSPTLVKILGKPAIQWDMKDRHQMRREIRLLQTILWIEQHQGNPTLSPIQIHELKNIFRQTRKAIGPLRNLEIALSLLTQTNHKDILTLEKKLMLQLESQKRKFARQWSSKLKSQFLQALSDLALLRLPPQKILRRLADQKLKRVLKNCQKYNLKHRTHWHDIRRKLRHADLLAKMAHNRSSQIHLLQQQLGSWNDITITKELTGFKPLSKAHRKTLKKEIKESLHTLLR